MVLKCFFSCSRNLSVSFQKMKLRVRQKLLGISRVQGVRGSRHNNLLCPCLGFRLSACLGGVEADYSQESPHHPSPKGQAIQPPAGSGPGKSLLAPEATCPNSYMNHGQLLLTHQVVDGAWDNLGHNDSGFQAFAGG